MSENVGLTKKISILESKITQLEQKCISNEIVIDSIREKPNEDVIDITKCVGHELNLKINNNMINDCYRIKSHGRNINLNRIVVKFVRHIDKINVLKARKIKRNFST